MGVTFLLLDMKAPGVSTRPIRFFSGDYEQSQVFFDNVRVPRTQVVGEENKGWSVTKYLLEFERGGGSAAPSLIRAIEQVRALRDTSSALPSETALRSRLDALEAEVAAARNDGTALPGGNRTTRLAWCRVVDAEDQGHRIVPTDHRSRDRSGGLLRRCHTSPKQSTATARAGFVGPEDALTVTPFYFNNRAASIYGGSNEIQRNIIAKAVLGL